MKTCPSCTLSKNEDEFHKRAKALDGLQYVCKACNCEQRKAYYKTARGRRNNFTNAVNQRDKMKQFVRSYLLEHPCVDCNEADFVVLEFDHREPEHKVAAIADMVRRGFAKQRIVDEMAKCDVRCANCHRRRTATQFGWR